MLIPIPAIMEGKRELEILILVHSFQTAMLDVAYALMYCTLKYWYCSQYVLIYSHNKLVTVLISYHFGIT